MMEVESDMLGSVDPMVDDGAIEELENVEHVENSQMMFQSQLSSVEQAIMDDIFASDDEEEDTYKQKVASVPMNEADFDEDMRDLTNTHNNSNPDRYSDIDEHSTSSESDQEDDQLPQSSKQALKKEKAAAKPRKTAVEMEIEAVKLLEKGPSEAELRRRKLIEMDPDELEEKIERLNRVGLEQVSKATGLSKAVRREKLITSRTFLGNLWKAKQYTEEIETYLEKQLNRLYGENDPPFDVYHYLEKDTYDDDEFLIKDEEVLKPKQEETVQEVVEEEKVIYLSDSDDDSEVQEGCEGETDHDHSNTSPSSVPAPVAAAAQACPESPIMPQKRPLLSFKGPVRVAANSRAALMISLRQKVLQTATENYCTQRKIKTEELQFHLDVTEHCRQLIEMLRDHYSELEVITRIARKKRYEMLAHADEEEFDESEGLGEGKFVSEEEKLRILRQFASENDSDDSESDDVGEADDEEAEGDNDDDDAMDVEEEGDTDTDKPEAEEVLPEQGPAAVEPSSPVNGKEKEEEDDEKEEDDSVQMKKKGKSKIGYDSDEDDHDKGAASSLAPAPLPDRATAMSTSLFPSTASVSVSAAASGRLVNKQYGRRQHQPSTSTATVTATVLQREGSDETHLDDTQVDTFVDSDPDSDHDDDHQDGNSEEEQQEEPQVDTQLDTQLDSLDTDNLDLEVTKSKPKKDKKKKRINTGNALYRLQLEEEEARLRNRPTSIFHDDEAEEEEETGRQSGLGDFGFGMSSTKQRELEEEKDALRLRKGDLDHIVDDISDDEGDEIAGAKARQLQELQEDRERMQMVITAVTEGHETAMLQAKKMKKSGYSFEALVSGKHKTTNKTASEDTQEGQEVDLDDELDVEAMLQRGFAAKLEREKRRRYDDSYFSDDDLDSTGGDSQHDQLLNEEQEKLLSSMTEEQRLHELEAIQRRREEERQQLLRRKQMEKDFKMRRELRQQQQRELLLQRMQPSAAGSGNKVVIGFGMPQLQLLRRQSSSVGIEDSHSRSISPRPGMVAGSAGGGSGALKDVPNLMPPMHRSTSLTANTTTTTITGGSKALHRTKTTATVVGNKGSKYSGELSRSEVENGYGMGMASAGLLTSHTTTTTASVNKSGGGGLFSMVTGQATATSASAAVSSVGNQPKKRSFSAMLHTAAGTSAAGGGGSMMKKRITPVSLGQQFVFMDTSSCGGIGDTTSRNHMPTTDTNANTNSMMRSSSMSAATTGDAGGSGAGAGESLFAKLGARSGGLKRSFTTKGN